MNYLTKKINIHEVIALFKNKMSIFCIYNFKCKSKWNKSEYIVVFSIKTHILKKENEKIT